MTPEQFLDHLHPEPNSGCFIWTGRVERDGYGRVWFDGRHERAHRLAWSLGKGAIPQGLQVLHRCDTPLCCNAEHLFLGTHQDNVDDCCRKNRQTRHSGEKQWMHKLTEEQVEALRRIPNPLGHVRARELAAQHGITWQHVYRIRAGLRWTHLAA